jgi:3-oxoacyl-(acyl-carrier-protein) synthase
MSQEACVVGGLNPMGVASTAWEVGKALGLSAGPRLTASGACASGLGALVRAAMMIRTGEVDRALVVAAEASVHPLFIGCFDRLGVLPPEGGVCRPMDERREGFLVSEAAAAVCLEAASESDSAARPWAVVDRFALGGDATHLTGSDPDGAALRRLLKDVTAGRAIDLVHAHATGTTFNDPIEVAAYEDVVGEGSPLVYSHKGALGHSLGASGLVSIVLNCMAHRTGIVPGNVRTERPIRSGGATPLRPIIHVMLSSTERRIRRSIAVAAGFGGAMGVVALTT